MQSLVIWLLYYYKQAQYFRLVSCLDELVLARLPAECEREQDPPTRQMPFVTG